MSVFIDVSGSCKSSRNTGVQRVTRQIFSELASQTSISPICWNRLGNYYHRLGKRELTRLVEPFSEYPSAVGRPEFRGEKFPGELRRRLSSVAIDLASELTDRDVLLVPDIYSDRRTQQLPELLRRTKARSIAIFHDASTLRLGLLSRRGAERFRKYTRSLAAFDLVICISDESQADLLQLWRQDQVDDPPETRVEGWPLEFDEKERASAHRSSRRVVLCVGSFDVRKNHLRLFEAANQLWDAGLDFELQLVGRSTGALGYKVVPKIRMLQAMGRPLWWLKHVDDHALHRAYRECDFTVYPSLAEGFGLPILESLWHGKPCICGNNGALGAVATGGGCLFVDQTDVSALAAGLRRLLTDPKTSATLAAEARQRKFRSWSDYTSCLLGYLQIQPEVPYLPELRSAAPAHGRFTESAPVSARAGWKASTSRLSNFLGLFLGG
jgi:glycosyltransferase involved in cell wall biosynthesis